MDPEKLSTSESSSMSKLATDYKDKLLELEKSLGEDVPRLQRGDGNLLEPQGGDGDILKGLMDERRDHRETLFKFIRRLTTASFSLVAIIVLFQGIMRAFYSPYFTILDGNELNILVVGVFGEIIGVIIIIAKSLWDDRDYLSKLK